MKTLIQKYTLPSLEEKQPGEPLIVNIGTPPRSVFVSLTACGTEPDNAEFQVNLFGDEKQTAVQAQIAFLVEHDLLGAQYKWQPIGDIVLRNTFFLVAIRTPRGGSIMLPQR